MEKSGKIERVKKIKIFNCLLPIFTCISSHCNTGYWLYA